MRADDFDYFLPEGAIAQRPVSPRDASRLLVLDRKSGEIQHRHFHDLPEYLQSGDALVLNDTRVIPARLIGRKEGTGGNAELLLLERRSIDTWETLVRPGRRLRPGARLVFGDALLRAEIKAVTAGGGRLVTFAWEGSFESLLQRLGEMPLPPYIKERLDEPGRYQTVYAEEDGSKAAPTAGLHFTERLLAEIANKGVRVIPITLHVGLGTFRPVTQELIAEHEMHAEYYRVAEEAADAIASAKARGSKVFAVGTTVVRTLEAAAGSGGGVCPGDGWTDIFIYPGYTFKIVDALLTNFHLPRSTLLMLVSAFAGRGAVLGAYEEAKNAGYRFFSFGDAMLVR